MHGCGRALVVRAGLLEVAHVATSIVGARLLRVLGRSLAILLRGRLTNQGVEEVVAAVGLSVTVDGRVLGVSVGEVAHRGGGSVVVAHGGHRVLRLWATSHRGRLLLLHSSLTRHLNLLEGWSALQTSVIAARGAQIG